MKKFLVLLNDKQPNALNEHLLKSHIDFLKKLRAAGNLPLCGPFTDNKGAILVLNAKSKEHAERMIMEDPFLKANYYKKLEIYEFTPAGDDNNWLSDLDQTRKNIQK